jgi:hypothetical protein
MRKSIFIEGRIVRAIPPMFNMWPCKLKLDEKKSKHVNLVQQNGFGPTILHNFLGLIKGTTKLNICQKNNVS